MGTVMRSKLILASIALAAIAVPSTGHAEAQTFTAPWPKLHQGGDSGNRMTADANTGKAQILRTQAGAPNGSLGCNAAGGYIEFELPITSTDPISKVTVSYRDAIVGPFGFVKAAIRKNNAGVQATVTRGPLQGDGTLVIDVTAPDGSPSTVSGPVDLWFGVEVSGACLPSPPFEIADATFTSVTVS